MRHAVMVCVANGSVRYIFCFVHVVVTWKVLLLPASHIIYPDQNVVVVTFEGRLTLPEIFTDYMAYCAADDWRQGQSVFIDTSRVVDFRITFQGLLSILKHLIGVLDPFDKTILTSIYAPTDMMYQKGLLHQRLTSSSEANCVGVFRSEREAWEFLGFDAKDIPGPMNEAPLFS